MVGGSWLLVTSLLSFYLLLSLYTSWFFCLYMNVSTIGCHEIRVSRKQSCNKNQRVVKKNEKERVIRLGAARYKIWNHRHGHVYPPLITVFRPIISDRRAWQAYFRVTERFLLIGFFGATKSKLRKPYSSVIRK
jgi:hypothetical protein